MRDFEKLEQLRDDHTIAWMAFKAVRHDADDLAAAVGARLRQEREQSAARVAELEQIVSDPSRSETVRRMAAAELAKIQERQFFATPEEVAAFSALVGEQESALRDIRQIQEDAKAAIAAATKRVAEIRDTILCDQNIDLAPRWIAGQKSEFAKLCEEV